MENSIFICYRRDDSSGYTGRIYDRLVSHFSSEQIFIDVDAIPYGSDFSKEIELAISKCDVVLVIIGRNWLHIADKTGHRMLDNATDFVRTEIRTGLERNISVLPVLVDNAPFLKADDLPTDIKTLSRINAFEFSHARFSIDSERLIKAIEKIVIGRREEYSWEETIKYNSFEGYQNYLKLYPNGKFSEDANNKIHFLREEEALEQQRRSKEQREQMQAEKEISKQEQKRLKQVREEKVKQERLGHAEQQRQKETGGKIKEIVKSTAFKKVVGVVVALIVTVITVIPHFQNQTTNHIEKSMDSITPSIDTSNITSPSYNEEIIPDVDSVFNNVYKKGFNSEAFRLFQIAAKNRNPYAMNYLGRMYQRVYNNIDSAMFWYKNAADSGNALAMTNIGAIYINGYGKVKKDSNLAIMWFTRAADSGNDVGMYNMGVEYRKGKNYKKAEEWFLRAEAVGYTRAMVNLGQLYEKGGNGLTKNIKTAIYWYQKAADKNNSYAKKYLILLSKKYK